MQFPIHGKPNTKPLGLRWVPHYYFPFLTFQKCRQDKIMKHYLYEEQETVFSNVQILIYVFDITSDTPDNVEVIFF